MADLPDDGASADVVPTDQRANERSLEIEALVRRIAELRLVPKLLDLSRAFTVATQAIQDFTKIMGELESCLPNESDKSPTPHRFPGQIRDNDN